MAHNLVGGVGSETLVLHVRLANPMFTVGRLPTKTLVLEKALRLLLLSAMSRCTLPFMACTRYYSTFVQMASCAENLSSLPIPSI